uniref:Vacuolar protein sorting-associated protein 18 homolog n=1 Tax=Phallusia mammillata TaxID=59560 RepID=A0A6F9DX62_9ASCI|nr:vacuolar protein sorting-associated protein 18 homolog [Phallusia mammillata]
MSSIFEQYEATMSRSQQVQRVSRSSSSTSTNPEPVSSGYVSSRLEDDTPIFNKSKINFKPQEPITHLAICNNMLCMVMSGRLLTRINLLHPDDLDEVEVTRGDDRVYKMYFDPTGHFLLLTLTSEETVFLSANSRKPKSLNKFKGHKIESIAWCQTSSGNTTGPVLVGTNWGLIMECSIEAGEDTKFFGGSVDQYFKEVFNLGKGEGKGFAVTGLEYFCTATKESGKSEYCIFASTPGRFYQFSGTVNMSSGDIPLFKSLFDPYKSVPPRHIDLPGTIDNSQLILLYNMKAQSALIPTQFAWMAAPGVYVGDIKVPVTGDESALQQRSLISNARLISYPDTAGDNDNPFAEVDDKVLNIVLTDFHLLLLYTDRMKVICSLNEQLIFEDVYTSRYGQLMGLFKDPVQSTIWTFTEKAVFKYKVVKEARDVWQMYLDMEKFDLAREYCRDNPVNLDKVLSRQAEHAFERGQYKESALYYAITQNSFEDVALKFLRAGRDIALRAFLQKKLSSVKPGEITQMTMLSTWLVELYLNELGKHRETTSKSEEEAKLKCRENLRKLLAQGRLKESFQENRGTIYDLLISHGDIEDYVFFAVLMQDYERVVNHHVQNEDYSAALDALRKQNNIQLYYKFSPVLMQHIPKVTVEAWIHLGRRIDPKHLIPSLVNCTQSGHSEQWAEALRYLQYCTRELNCRDSAIHNYLLSLYVKHQPDAVISYLKEQGNDSSDVCYDVKYGLRLCLGNDAGKSNPVLLRACVIIYTVMCLYEEAVAMALKVDVDLAKSIADRQELEEEDEELRKKLWLKIAKHVVQEDKDIKRAMKFLQESGDLLKIEDILPFFPDFVTIDHFKDALCESLAEYNKHIDQLKDEMNDATTSAHSIRANIQETRNQHLVVGPTERCCVCGRPLLTRGFYLFPCNHAFHSDCLWNEARPLLNETKQNNADRLQLELRMVSQSMVPGATDQAARDKKARRQQLILDLDDIIANECVLCGEIAVRAIDAPFKDNEDGDRQSWL